MSRIAGAALTGLTTLGLVGSLGVAGCGAHVATAPTAPPRPTPGAVPAFLEDGLGARCAALGPAQPASPPASACRAAPPLLDHRRPSYVPGGRWLDPAPRSVAPAPAPRRPSSHQRYIPPHLELQPRVAGCLDTGIFRRKFREQRPALRCCLLASPATQPSTLVRIRFTLPCRGRAEQVRVQAEPVLAPRVARCLEQVVSTWQFPGLRPGETAQIMYPLRYKPGSASTSTSVSGSPAEPR